MSSVTTVNRPDTDEEILSSLNDLSKEELVEKCKELMSSYKTLENQLKTVQPQSETMKAKAKKKVHKQRPFDFDKYGKRRIAFKFLYLGWDYQGFASQDNTTNTIEEELFTALVKSKLIKERSTANYSRCGRTDKGVSAFGQVIALDVRTNGPPEDIDVDTRNQSTGEQSGISESNHEDVDESETVGVQSKNHVTRDELPYVQILNRLLPPDIRVVAHAAVGVDFDARFSCKTRRYKYFFPASNFDIELMNEAAQRLTGQHDFRNFCKVDIGNNVNHFIRNVVSFSVKRTNTSMTSNDLCEMDITGLAFLWHQVRCMAAVLMLIGLRLEKPEVIDFLLDIEKCPKRPQYNMAFEYPLVLYECLYENVEWIYEREFNEPNVNRVQQMWSKKAIQSTMLHSMLNDLKSRTLLNIDPSLFQISAILPGYRIDNYKQLSSRSVCEGLDRHLETLAAKRVKLEEKYLTSLTK